MTNLAQISREKPSTIENSDDARDAGRVREHDLEAGKVDLRLFARRRLEPHLEAALAFRPDLLNSLLDRGVATREAAVAKLSQEANRAQTRISSQTFAQVGKEVVGASWSPWLRAIVRRFHAAGDIFAHRLAVDAELTGDGGGAEPLPVQIQDHHKLPKSNHRFAPSTQGEQFR